MRDLYLSISIFLLNISNHHISEAQIISIPAFISSNHVSLSIYGFAYKKLIQFFGNSFTNIIFSEFIKVEKGSNSWIFVDPDIFVLIVEILICFETTLSYINFSFSTCSVWDVK